MEFNPNNPIVRLCVEGMGMENRGRSDEATRLFVRAWGEATEDFEKFIAAHCIARAEQDISERLRWLEIVLQIAKSINDDSVKSALPALYADIGKSYERLDAAEKANYYYGLAASIDDRPSAKGPFYHGTRADLTLGALLTAGGTSNYKPELTMNHVYFTALVSGAGLAAALAKGEGPQRIYIVEPMGSFEHDPNVTNKKFPGNLTQSYRSQTPLKVVGEVTDWENLTPEQLRQWREKIAKNNGEIIN